MSEEPKTVADWHHCEMIAHNAALPDDDPRKITRARVEAIRIAADYWCPRDGDSQAWDEYRHIQNEIRSFADALAALLPPE